MEDGEERIGYEFKCGESVSRSDAAGRRAGLTDGVITRAMVVYAGSRRYPLTDEIEAMPAATLLGDALMK